MTWGSGWQGGQGLAGEVAAGDGFEQVVDSGGEGPFGGCFGLAPHRQLAEAQVVFDVPVRGLCDVAALAVGGDAVFGCQPPGHRYGGWLGPLAPGGAAAAGGASQAAELAGGDEPVGAGC